MRLSFVCQTNNRTAISLDGDGRWINLTQVMRAHPDRFPWLELRREPTMVDLLENTPDLLPCLDELLAYLDTSGQVQHYMVDEDIQLLSPVTRPSKIIALGLNYLAHAQEAGHSAPDEPIIFAKAPSSIIGPDADIIYPDMVTRLDPEIELGVVIGRRAKNVAEEEAFEYVAGYTIINDVTARDMQAMDLGRAHPWFRSKSFDTFCPMGPHLVLKDEIVDPHQLRLTLRVNGQVRQDCTTADCIFKIPQIVAFVSKHMTLEPGDVIATGTPDGIAPMERGDVVECTISGLGTLVNRVV